MRTMRLLASVVSRFRIGDILRDSSITYGRIVRISGTGSWRRVTYDPADQGV